MTRRKEKTIAPKEVDNQIGEAFAKEGSSASLAVRDPVEPPIPQKEADQFLQALAKEEIKDKKQARANKRRRGNADVGMSNKAFWLTVGWCAFVALVVILVGAGVLVLSDPVLIALIASAGLPAIIKALSGWFKSDKSE